MKLPPAEIKGMLQEVASWQQDGDRITRTFQFRNFSSAFVFMTGVAFLAEKHNHHPDWQNCYDKVTIALSTHDADGLTIKDFRLAKAIDELCCTQGL